MSADGENILKLIKQVRSLCEQLSLLLRTADESMIKAGWQNESSNAIAEISWSIRNPERWMPIAAFRYYTHKDHKNLLAYVSILLDDHWDRRYAIKEPLATAGFFDYGKGAEVGENWDYWYLRYFGYLSKDHNLKPNGQPFHFKREIVPSSIQGKFKKLFEKGAVFALPLTSITNASEVDSLITGRLLKLVSDENL